MLENTRFRAAELVRERLIDGFVFTGLLVDMANCYVQAAKKLQYGSPFMRSR
jgi:hypothetical protein